MTIVKTDPRSISRRGHALGVACMGLAAMTLTGCAASHSANQTQTLATQHANKGYIVQQSPADAPMHETWTVNGRLVDVTLMAPAGSGPYPLVVYLPALGESSDAGTLWRQAWVAAGYTVVSMQPLSDGKVVWSMTAARAGEFNAIAKEHFSIRSLADRLETMRGAIDELKRRQIEQASLFDRIDMSRMAVAGFDLGAQTAMVLAGEQIDGIQPPAFSNAIKCVIALSPYADFSGMGIEARFRSIHVPVLSVTSPDDLDPYGLLGSAAVHRAPYQYMPAGKKYLLLLSSASHSLLAGKEASTIERATSDPSSRGADGAESGNGGNQGAAGNKKGSHGSRKKSRSSASPQQETSPLSDLEITDVQQISTAYLDATVKNDPVAWEWLTKDATRWLGDTATLSTK